jgi:hypothetical protein
MLTAIRKTVPVQPGGKVQFSAPELEFATEAEVIVLVEESNKGTRSLASFIGSGKGLFKSPEEVDAYIRSERDAWEK